MNVAHLIENELWGQGYTVKITARRDKTALIKMNNLGGIASRAFILLKLPTVNTREALTLQNKPTQSAFNCGPAAVVQECLTMPKNMGGRL